MRKTTIAVIFAAAAALAACDNFSSEPAEETEASVEEPVVAEPMAPPVEEVPAPAAQPAPAPTGENQRLPPDTRSSEESVRPDSETVFY